jgi:pyruvate/2-oxoglutarate dehydrogenase complex dihydrolipoamide dehydrogenase (E3) component
VRVDGPAVMRRIHRVVEDGRRYYEDLIGSDDGALLVREQASFADGRLLLGGRDVGLDGVPTVLAVGAAPARVLIPGAAEVPYLTACSSCATCHARSGSSAADRSRWSSRRRCAASAWP